MNPARLRVPRALHPGAWWVWAIGLATAAARTTNPLLLVLILVVAGTVVGARRSDAPWSRSFAVFLQLGLVVVAIRVVFQVVFGASTPGTVLVVLPEVPLPAWAAGVTLGGAITLEAMAAALVEGLRLATMLACIGAANALANPKRLLAALPPALYEVGVTVVVALSFAPSMVASVQRIRAARRLRGHPDRGVRGVITVAMPVLEDALERSLELAAAMDSRGYGRRAAIAPGRRRATAVLTLAGLLGICLGVYGLLDATGPAWLGGPVLLVGVVAAGAGLRGAGRRTVRTRYRPDPWAWPEWATTATGLAAGLGAIVTGLTDPGGLTPALVPLTAIGLPVAATIGVLTAVLPAWLTPAPPSYTVPARPAVPTPPPSRRREVAA